MKSNANKIFGIGLSKTGTSSLCDAMSMLGYKSVHYICPEEKIIQIIQEHDFINDMPIQTRYRTYDTLFPNSKFILTIRPNMEEWLKSCEYQWNTKQPSASMKYRIEQMGSSIFDRHKFEQKYVEHTNIVLEYFKYRIKDLLILDIFGDQDPWQSLCQFLGKTKPTKPFPHKNKQ